LIVEVFKLLIESVELFNIAILLLLELSLKTANKLTVHFVLLYQGLQTACLEQLSWFCWAILGQKKIVPLNFFGVCNFELLFLLPVNAIILLKLVISLLKLRIGLYKTLVSLLLVHLLPYRWFSFPDSSFVTLDLSVFLWQNVLQFI